MPQIKIQHVVSCSSEDKVYKAENLLKPDTYRKWKCGAPGEKQVSVILQFEKAVQINSIDIGNEGSAFTEVLVGNSSSSKDDFQVLLVTSSFMSPMESRQGTNANRVRLFGREKLSNPVADQKWDRVKVVCTQPFNKNIQYGLSFIKFHSPPEKTSSADDKPSGTIGAFRLKVSNEDDLQVGTYFAKRKENGPPSETSPAAIRQASSLAAAVLASSPAIPKRLPAAQFPSAKKPSDNTVKLQGEKTVKNFTEHKAASVSTAGMTTQSKPSQPARLKSPERNLNHKRQLVPDEPPAKKLKESDTPLTVPFNQLMEKVVFALSGFQNPYRSQLRDHALDMGARYRADWDKSCTHLICAFINTPKYVQVRSAGGRVVSKEWILDCHKRKKLMDWRKYKMGDYSSGSSSDEELSNVKVNKKDATPLQNQTNISNDRAVRDSPKPKTTLPTESKKVTPNKAGIFSSVIAQASPDSKPNSDDEYGCSTDVDTPSEGGDTEDEIRRVIKNNVDKSPKKSPIKRPDTTNIPLPDLPDMFKGKHFLLCGDFSDEESRTISRYIVGYGGILHDYMNEGVKFVITNLDWDDKFDEAVMENENLVFVRPRWIYRCSEVGKPVPYQPFVAVPET